MFKKLLEKIFQGEAKPPLNKCKNCGGDVSPHRKNQTVCWICDRGEVSPCRESKSDNDEITLLDI